MNLSPRLLVVPVNTCVLLACEVRYAGSYSVQWYRDSDEHPFHSNPSVENSSTINHILSVTNEYNNTLIQCVVHTDLSENDVTAESNSITVIAIPEGIATYRLTICQRMIVVALSIKILLTLILYSSSIIVSLFCSSFCQLVPKTIGRPC